MGPYCKFCGQRCFVYLPMETPKEALEAYGTSTIIATCKDGQSYEKSRTGWCLDDIKAAIKAKDPARER
ncbi:hypothetical protein EDM54_12965 [Brevibacillus borstelensis]|nr:hypothetical protein EDM54_12965 [Brevibacillus borstelensis]GED55856.1 hypothetical protein BBO01nite_50970 [Brevibacillus borstelensis]